MARYRKIDVRTWGDENFRSLSKPPPNGQSLWFFLLTGPHTTQIPGVSSVGEMGLAEFTNWPLEGFRKAFHEVISKGMVKADLNARLLWIPNAIKYNKPESPNVVKSWENTWDELPECDLKNEIYQYLKSYLEGLGEAFAKAFDEACRKPSLKAMANYEQEQEQEQELNTLVQKSVQTHEKTKNEKHLKGFEQFWNAYPRKQNRGRAEKAWQSLAPSEPLTVKILQAVEEAKTSEDWRKEGGQFIPHPSSWLNAKGWLDEGLDLKALNTAGSRPPDLPNLPKPPTDEEREASLQAMREAKKNLPWLDLGGGDSTLPKQKVEAEKPPNEPIIPVRSLDGLINGLTGKLSMTG